MHRGLFWQLKFEIRCCLDFKLLVDLMLTCSIFKWQNVISIGVITKNYIITRTGIKCIVDRSKCKRILSSTCSLQADHVSISSEHLEKHPLKHVSVVTQRNFTFNKIPQKCHQKTSASYVLQYLIK